MALIAKLRKGIEHIAFGNTLLPQEFTIGLPDPQSEISLWLYGMGTPLDVTRHETTVCCEPFVVCIAFSLGQEPNERCLNKLSLKFCERGEVKRLLGEIGLREAINIPRITVGETTLLFFAVRSTSNYCLSNMRLGAHYLLYEYSLRRHVNTSGIVMSFLERRAAMVSFIRPHPISLVSVTDGACGNIFTMNLMGELGPGRFGFALKDSRTPAHLVQRVGRLALSTVPLYQSHFVFEFAANHFKQSIEWNHLPFKTRQSCLFHIPVPLFAARVREMEVETIRKVGSHHFFVARVVSDETFDDGEIVCAIHGFYQVWRMQGRAVDLKDSVAQHWINKRGPCVS
jgi:flavin reductase (DIM6/NTAB) family NADH-FMN oxidoreductase RutF